MGTRADDRLADARTAEVRLERLITGLQALQRYDASGYDDATGFHGSLRLEPDGCYYLVDDVQRLIADAQKG